MKRTKWIFIISQVLIFSALPLFNAHAAEKKTIELRYATFFPTTDKQAQLGNAWAIRSSNSQKRRALVGAGLFNRLSINMKVE